MTEKDKKVSSKPPKEELQDAEKEFDEACAKVEAASKRHTQAANGLKRTISDSKMKAVRLPTPSQLDLEETSK